MCHRTKLYNPSMRGKNTRQRSEFVTTVRIRRLLCKLFYVSRTDNSLIFYFYLLLKVSSLNLRKQDTNNDYENRIEDNISRIKFLQSEISKLRNQISEQYAEDIGKACPVQWHCIVLQKFYCSTKNWMMYICFIMMLLPTILWLFDLVYMLYIHTILIKYLK